MIPNENTTFVLQNNLLNRVLIASRDSTRDLKLHTHKTRLVNSNIEDGE